MRILIGLAMSMALAVSALVAVPASAATDVFHWPWSQAVPVPCANGGEGEDVFIVGGGTTVFRPTIDSNGGIHTTFKFVSHYHGTGLVTGDMYVANHTHTEVVNVRPGDLPFTETLVEHVKLTGTGQASDLRIRETYHITVNANGQVSVETSIATAVCDGIPFDPIDM